MKNFISNLVAFAATLLINLCFGIALTTSCAVLVSFILIENLAYVVYKHIKEKKMPVMTEWIQYTLELLMLILGVCGIYYKSLITIIIAIIMGIGSIICYALENSKKKVE